MKKRITALLLLLALALTACTSAAADADKETREKRIDETEATELTDATELTEATEATEETTEASEATEETLPGPTNVDLGVIDGNTYRNETLGITAAFPEEWYIYNETDLGSLNKLILTVFDDESVAEALERAQELIVFCASDPATMTSVQIAVGKNAQMALDEAAIVNGAAPMIVAQYEQSGIMQNVVSSVAETEFCGQKHAVFSVTGETMGMQLYGLGLFLPCGDLVYGFSFTTAQESMIEECLGMFEAIK